MNQFLFGIKREYWEYKRLLIIMPVIVTGIFCLIAIVATFAHNGGDSIFRDMDDSVKIDISIDGSDVTQDRTAGDNKKVTVPGDSEGKDVSPDEQEGAKQPSVTDEDGDFWFTGVYLAAAWLAALFYALSSLYNDRRDKSILYWKTMPVSDLTTVLSKFCFTVLGFSLIAVAVSLISGLIFIAYANIALPAELVARDSAGMNFSMMVVWPLATIFLALVWCAPVFALMLFVSAWAKKMPFLMLIVPVIVIRLVEKIVFGSDRIFSFLVAHSPFTLLESHSQMDGVGQYLQTYLVDSFASLLMGLVVAAVLIWGAAWHRKYRFEL